MTCNPFICTILFGLSELSKITLFKDLVGKIIEAKVAEMAFFALFRDIISNYAIILTYFVSSLGFFLVSIRFHDIMCLEKTISVSTKIFHKVFCFVLQISICRCKSIKIVLAHIRYTHISNCLILLAWLKFFKPIIIKEVLV